MQKMNRNKFFGTIGKGAIVAAITSVLPIKLFSNLSTKNSEKKIQVVVHPSAIKRNDKV